MCIHDLCCCFSFSLNVVNSNLYLLSSLFFFDNEFNYFHFKYFTFPIVVFKKFWALKLSFQALHLHPFSMTPLHKPLTKFYPHLSHATTLHFESPQTLLWWKKRKKPNNAIENLGTIRKIDLILKLFNTKGNNFLKFQTSKKFKIPKFPKII